MTSKTGQQIIAMYIYIYIYIVHISRSKSNQVVKFGQLIEYIMRNIFLEKSYTKFYGKASPRPFYKI